MMFPATSPLLAIDTAGAVCSVALWAEDGVLAQEVTVTQHGHATALAPMIERLVVAAAADLRSLGAVAVSCGPGGFTGMRVGLAMARALALSIGCPAIGIGSFQVLANAAGRAAALPAGHMLAVLDSRREELFAIELDAALAAIGDAMLLRPEAIAELCARRALPLLVDAGVPELDAQSFADLNVLRATSDAAAVAELAARRPDLRLSAEPIYVRPPDVSQPKVKPQ